MAGRMVGAGHEVRIYNRSPGKAADLFARGAIAADTPRAAAQGAETIISMVADDDASRAVWSGPDGALAGAPAAGELTLFAGASAADLEAVRPLLEPLCTSIVRFGEVGAGTAYKLMQNLLGSIQIAATAEALRTAELAGLDMPPVRLGRVHRTRCGRLMPMVSGQVVGL